MQAFLGLGSNLGDRLSNLQAALNLVDLRAGEVIAVSRVYETAPMYIEEQPSFYNAAARIETPLDAPALLQCLKALEEEAGRIPRERYGAREIDLDLLAAADENGELIRLDSEALCIPHPKLLERRFALEPLREVCPNEIAKKLGIENALQHLRCQSVRIVEDAVLSIHRD